MENDNQVAQNKGRKRTLKKGPIDENFKPPKKAKKKVVVKIYSSDDDDDVQIIPDKKKKGSFDSFASSSTASACSGNDNEMEAILEELARSRSWSPADVICEQINIERRIAQNILQLFDQECTIPFIARYRKEMTGGLDAEKLLEIQEAYSNVKVVQKKVETVAKTLHKENKLDRSLVNALCNATTINEVDDLYAPFKPGSKKSLAQKARQLGLEESALKILFNQAGPMEFNPQNYVNKQIKDLDSSDKVLLGWQRIMADVVSKDSNILSFIKTFYTHRSIEIMATKSNAAQKEDAKAETEGSSTNNFKFENYFNFKNSIVNINSHQVLALNRGEKNKILSVKVVVPNFIRDAILKHCSQTFHHNYSVAVMKKLFEDTFEDAYQRLIEPLICRHIRSDLTKNAEKESVRIFCSNLKQLLLTPPVRGNTVLGIDPGFSHGCKLAVVSSKGEVLSTEVLYLHGNKASRYSNQAHSLKQCLLNFGVETIALGNGTACRETESFLSTLIKDDFFKPLKVHYCIVDESGVSIYSVSKEAEAELPNMDPNLRSAVGLARRLQDPLLEYVKIEPKHLGVGQYQHDIPKPMLESALDEVVIQCVSFVGVDLNVVSEVVLRRVSGLTASRAKGIVQWREANGFFKNRQQLLKVKGIGPKTFEQCAGFVKIIPQTTQDIFEAKIAANKKKKAKVDDEDSFNPLDMTVIHPESYATTKTFLELMEIPLSEIGSDDTIKKVTNYLNNHSIESLAEILNISNDTMSLIGDALKQSVTYDIRSEMGEPLFKTGIMLFEELKVGQKLTGRVQNNTTFGAFVDVGVGTSGLIHKSQMRHQDLLVGDRVEVEILSVDIGKKRLGLKLLSKGFVKATDKAVKTEIPSYNSSNTNMKTEIPSYGTNRNLQTEIPSHDSSNWNVKTEIPSYDSSNWNVKTEIPSYDSSNWNVKNENPSYNSNGANEKSETKPRDVLSSNFKPNNFHKNYKETRNINDFFIGQRLDGVVRSVKIYGAFVDIGSKRDGLIHCSKMNGVRLEEGNQVSVEVIEVDIPRSRISLRLLQSFQVSW